MAVICTYYKLSKLRVQFILRWHGVRGGDCLQREAAFTTHHTVCDLGWLVILEQIVFMSLLYEINIYNYNIIQSNNIYFVT